MKQPFFFEGNPHLRTIAKGLLLFCIFFLFCSFFTSCGKENSNKKTENCKTDSKTAPEADTNTENFSEPSVHTQKQSAPSSNKNPKTDTSTKTEKATNADKGLKENKAPETTTSANTSEDSKINKPTPKESPSKTDKSQKKEDSSKVDESQKNKDSSESDKLTQNETSSKTDELQKNKDSSETDKSIKEDISSGQLKAGKKMKTLFSQIETLLPQENGNWAVYVCDLVSDTESSINDKSMQAASLIKLYIMGAVYENYEPLIKQYGQENVDSALYSMITVSDNDTANALVSYLGDGDSSLGMSVVNNFCLDHGFTASHMGRLLLQSSQFGDNYTSVADCGRFLKAIYEKDTEQFSYADAMFSLLSNQTRRNKIPAKLPEDVHTANKTGELTDVENDAAILYDTSNDLIIVFMSEYVTSVGSAQDSIASISRQIYDYYNNDSQ